MALKFLKPPEKEFFDSEKFKNKLFFRKMLKDGIGLDSDNLGKMDYQFNFYSICCSGFIDKWNSTNVSKHIMISTNFNF